MALLATEFLKLRTQRSMRILLLVSVLLTVLGFVLFALGLPGIGYVTAQALAEQVADAIDHVAPVRRKRERPLSLAFG